MTDLENNCSQMSLIVPAGTAMAQGQETARFADENYFFTLSPIERTAVGAPGEGEDDEDAIVDEEEKEQYEVRKDRPSVNVEKDLQNVASLDTLSAQAYSQRSRNYNYQKQHQEAEDDDDDSYLYCYLKTKMGKFRRHAYVINSEKIIFYRNPADKSRSMEHPLTECHVRLAKKQKVDVSKGERSVYYPVQVDVHPDRTRLLYFTSSDEQRKCLDLLLKAQGFNSQLDQYI